MANSNSFLGGLGDSLMGIGDNLGSYAIGGAGAAITHVATDYALSKFLVNKDGTPMIPVKFSPAVIGVGGLILAGVMQYGLPKLNVKSSWVNSLTEGMAIGGIGLMASSYVAMFTAPAVAATVTAATTAEKTTTPNAVAGFGFGRVFATNLRGLAGLRGLGDPSLNPNNQFTPKRIQPGAMNGVTTAVQQVAPKKTPTQVQTRYSPSLAGTFQ